MGNIIRDEQWTAGYCSDFAVGLKQRYGGEIWAVVNHSAKYPEDDYFYHCYCVIGDTAYDADGGHTIQSASDVSAERYPVPEMDAGNEVSTIWIKVDEEWLVNAQDGEFNPDENAQVYAYIERHAGLFAGLVQGTKSFVKEGMRCDEG